MTPACEICSARPPFRYECRSCKRGVCDECRSAQWEDKKSRFICSSVCVDCRPRGGVSPEPSTP